MKSGMLVLPHTAVIIIGFVLLMDGMWISEHRIPETDCLQPSLEGNRTRSDLNTYASVGGLPAMVSGILACLAGGLGSLGGMRKSKRAMIYAATLLVFAGLVAVVAFALAMLSKTISDVVCSGYTCGDGQLCVESTCSGSHAKLQFALPADQRAYRDESSADCSWICRNDYNAICEYGSQSFVAGLICTLLMLITFITACLACGAGWWFTESFEMEEQVEVFTAPPASPSSTVPDQTPPLFVVGVCHRP